MNEVAKVVMNELIRANATTEPLAVPTPRPNRHPASSASATEPVAFSTRSATSGATTATAEIDTSKPAGDHREGGHGCCDEQGRLLVEHVAQVRPGHESVSGGSEQREKGEGDPDDSVAGQNCQVTAGPPARPTLWS